jgi:hypothetical protein
LPFDSSLFGNNSDNITAAVRERRIKHKVIGVGILSHGAINIFTPTNVRIPPIAADR